MDEALPRISPLALGICLAAPLVALGRERPPLVLISIDGLRPRDVFDTGLPHLGRLLAEGTRATVKSIAPALTYPAHTTLVTGVSPERHGILQNKPFDPLGRTADGWYWYAEDIRVPTLWDAAARAGLATASVDWPVTVG